MSDKSKCGPTGSSAHATTMLPIRCFTCNNLIGHMWEPYLRSRQEEGTPKERLDRTGLTRICCRRMLLTHVHIIDDTLDYANRDTVLDECHTTLCCLVSHERTIPCK